MVQKTVIIIAAVFIALGAGYFVSKQNSSDSSQSQANTTDKTEVSKRKGPGVTLDLSGQQLTALPDSVLTQDDVTILNISNNQLTTLPADITKLVNLEVLNIENNRMESLPDEISQLKNLREIHANNNRMKSLPNALESMTQLKLLDISGNNIPSDQIQQLKSKLSGTQVKP